jgi:hypothetical protein
MLRDQLVSAAAASIWLHCSEACTTTVKKGRVILQALACMGVESQSEEEVASSFAGLPARQTLLSNTVHQGPCVAA